LIQQAIRSLITGHNLSEEVVSHSVKEIIDETATPAQIGALLMGLTLKGETAEEIASFASTLREYSIRIYPRVQGRLIDTCGTGGDMSGSFNVSTLATFVAAGAGAKVAKHGNRSVSSRCGSADLLERLGVNIFLTPEESRRSIEEIGVGFLFAPSFHPALKKVAGIRKELGIRTVFNLMGPLLNPAPIRGQLMGVHSESLVEVMAGALKRMGVEEALVVHGLEGLDEISVINSTKISWLKDGKITTRKYIPEELGVKRYTGCYERISDVDHGASVALGVLNNTAEGITQDMVVVNAAAALVVSGLVDRFDDGCELAKHSIKSGAAMKKLEQLVKFTGGDTERLKYIAKNAT
jgi:anthranilate phosphoribosyltransferase